MTADQRIFLRRHVAAFERWGDKQAARRATIRAGIAIGITQSDIAQFFGVARKTVYAVVHGNRIALNELQQARDAIAKADRVLRIWQGKERAAVERLRSAA